MARTTRKPKTAAPPVDSALPPGAAPPAAPGPAAESAARNREQLVRWRAFELFELRLRDGRPGDPDADWLQAEREVDERLARPPRDAART
ncbi:MAG: DUF2934 domain-containing protein [Phycisphaerae bacterium]